MIPKIVHYCWLSGDPYPKHIEKNIASWKKVLPDYEFVLWNKVQFDFSQSLWVQQACESKKFAFASDFIRLYALYHHGGIYLDADVEVVKSFDDLLELPYFMGLQHDNLVEAAVIGAEKHADWLLDCMQHYEERSFIKEDGDLDIRVLPSIIKSQVKEKRNLRLMNDSEAKFPYKLNSDKETFNLFPFTFFCAKNYDTGKISVTDSTYAIHHFDSSWLPFLSRVRRKLIKNIGVQKTEDLIELARMRKIAKILKIQ